MYKRLIEGQITSKFFQGKVIILTGSRQIGKTTLSLEIIKKLNLKKQVLVLNCDNPTERELLSNKDLSFLKKVIGKANIVFIDEGQKVATIGQTLKLLVDHYKKKNNF